MLKNIIFLAFILFPLKILASVLAGIVYEDAGEGKRIPLPNVHVYWSGTTTGTFTNEEGKFSIEKVKVSTVLVVSFVGFDKDSTTVQPDEKEVTIVLSRNMTLKTLVITARESTTFLSKYDPILTQNITGAELHKAACCNLGESFETNASVDVSYGDAISGAKKIELLGLAGIYSQLMIENIPDYQGFGRAFGMSYIPGHWLESISVSKGAASVSSGNESITGQISADIKKPDSKELLYINLYGNSHGHLESNFNGSVRINPNLSTMILAHTGYNNQRIDHNGDGFMDDPLTKRYQIMNRWKWTSKNQDKSILQAGFQYLEEDRLGGQMAYTGAGDSTGEHYGIDVATYRLSGFIKGCYIMKHRVMTSISTMNNLSIHDQKSIFGLNKHTVDQRNINTRLVFDTYLGTTNHLIQTGFSYQSQNYLENFNDSIMDQKEELTGIFGQYTFTYMKLLTILAGFRADYNNLYGLQWTPRMHIRYQPEEHTTIRLSVGKGYRSAHIFAENLFLLASSRQIVFKDQASPEIAWNYGVHASHEFTIGERKATLNAEVFRTSFSDQMIIDMDQDISHIYIYQLKGNSYANNFQMDFTFEPIKRLDILLAVRVSDVKTTINGDLVEMPFSKKYKGLANLSYKTPGLKWQFDYTAQFNGPSRLPDNDLLPAVYKRGTSSPPYVIINAQITKYFKHWNIYAGGENLTNFVQHHPIIAADDPFGQYFDASQVWGPVIGRKFYAGLRYYIKKY
jgi:outer membrane receptor for ferrienterochelin and colicins